MTRYSVRHRVDTSDFTHALVLAGRVIGIVWQSIQPSLGHQHLLEIKTLHIPNFSYEPRPQNLAYIHDNRIFWQLSSLLWNISRKS